MEIIEIKVIIMRFPVLMEDEGRHFYIKGPLPESEAKAWIEAQKDEYFKPSDYYYTSIGEQHGNHNKES